MLEVVFDFVPILSMIKPAANTVPLQGHLANPGQATSVTGYTKGHYYLLRQTSWAIWLLLLWH